MKIQYQLSEEELLKGLRFATRKLSKRGKRALIFYVVVGLFLVGASFTILWGFSSKYTPLFSVNYFKILFTQIIDPILVACLFGAGVASLVNAYHYPNESYKRWLKKPGNRTLLLKQTLLFTEQGLSFTDSDLNHSLIAWKTFQRVLQTEAFFYLETQEDRFITIPKVQLNTDEIVYIDQQLQLRFSDRYSLCS